MLNELGHAPTVTELCEATGLPKSSISRYIAAQMEQGVIHETIDPSDRRRRMLTQTDAGRAERQWQIRQMREILENVREWDESVLRGETPLDPARDRRQISARQRGADITPRYFQLSNSFFRRPAPCVCCPCHGGQCPRAAL